MQISIEYIKFLCMERAKLNAADLKDIEFFEDGMKVDISPETIKKFELTGLNNVDFITSGEYKNK